MSKGISLECPNCGSSDFVEVAPQKHRCTYCGTVLTLPREPPRYVKCPHCGLENERGSYYCSQCGTPLVSIARPAARAPRDPALTSILVTIIGSLFVPLLGAAAGLFLAYRALREARAGQGGSERLARMAIIIGWGGIALVLLPLLFGGITLGVRAGYSACSQSIQALFDMLRGSGGR